MSSSAPVDDLEPELRSALDRGLVGTLAVPARLRESIRYSLLAPGKRIRPRLALATAEMLGLAREPALRAAISIEMVHCFTLIHDDLPCMDDDDFRRGQPTNHKVYGEAMALLAGDALIALAFDALLEASEHVESGSVLRAVKRLSLAVGPRGVIGGQAAEPELGAASTLTDLRDMHARKTGALFSAALLLPADLAGADLGTPAGEVLVAFAAELGLAFQVLDDLEDANQDETGPTNVLHYVGFEEARSSTLATLRSACADLLTTWGEPARPLLAIAGEVDRKLVALKLPGKEPGA